MGVPPRISYSGSNIRTCDRVATELAYRRWLFTKRTSSPQMRPASRESPSQKGELKALPRLGAAERFFFCFWRREKIKKMEMVHTNPPLPPRDVTKTSPASTPFTPENRQISLTPKTVKSGVWAFRSPRGQGRRMLELHNLRRQ